MRLNQKLRTLKKGYDIWEERPRIVATELVQSFSEFSHMVERIEKTGQIVHVTMNEFNDEIEFIFHDGTPPYREV